MLLRAIDLCCGAGGWACAARGLPIQMVGAVDLWEPACKTYQLNNPGTYVIKADLREASVQEQVCNWEDIDIVLGGIPCEWLSVYRNLVRVGKGELEAQRATLDCVLALVKRIAPRWWCLEDVEAITKELPPFTPYSTLNARSYSPQRRKRVYVGDFPLPIPGTNREMMASRLRAGPYRIGRRSAHRKPVTHRSFARDFTLAAYPDRKSPTILSCGSRRDAEMVIVDATLPSGQRQMEWQEAASLQGFPDDYVFWGSPSDVTAMVGRAIQIDTGRAILEAICAKASKRRT